jgi:hypothetical protein
VIIIMFPCDFFDAHMSSPEFIEPLRHTVILLSQSFVTICLSLALKHSSDDGSKRLILNRQISIRFSESFLPFCTTLFIFWRTFPTGRNFSYHHKVVFDKGFVAKSHFLPLYLETCLSTRLSFVFLPEECGTPFSPLHGWSAIMLCTLNRIDVVC